MQPNTYPDGFPMSALDAINFSYFLSEGEKEEWREWLSSATPDQQQELVDTLHAMWQENQKEVVPQGFTDLTNTNQASAQPAPNGVPSQAPQTTPSFDTTPQAPAPQIQQVQQPTPPPFNPFEEPKPQAAPVSEAKMESDVNNTTTPEAEIPPLPPLPPVNFDEEKKPAPAPRRNDNQPQKYDSERDKGQNNQNVNKNNRPAPKKTEGEDDSIINFGQTKYKPNPILEDRTPAPSEFTYNQNSKSSRSANEPSSNREIRDESRTDRNEKVDRDGRNDRNDRDRKDNQAPNGLASRSFFNVSKVREASTRKALEDIYQQYLTSREKSFSSEREYHENHGMFLDKIMQVVVNFEQVADYFESMTQKLLEMNDKMVVQARENQELRVSVQNKQADVQDQIDELRRDVDRLFRDTKDIRMDYRHKVEDITTQMAAFGADAYRQDGVLQRLDLIMAKVHKLEQGAKESGSTQNLSIADRMRGRNTQEPQSSNSNNSQSSQQTNSRSDRKGTIDLRGVV
jgi:hypothetical protein